MKLIIITAFLVILQAAAWGHDTLNICSPSGKICVKVWMQNDVVYQVAIKGKTVLLPSRINMQLQNKPPFSEKNEIKSYKKQQVSNQIISPVPEKRKTIPDVYSLLSLQLSQPYTLQFRVYDDGVAYRFITAFKDSIKVKNELAEFNFSRVHQPIFPGFKKEKMPIFTIPALKNYTPLKSWTVLGWVKWPIHPYSLFPMIASQNRYNRI